MAFVDSIGGYIAAKAGEGPSVTANFNANFMRPAPVGAWIEGTGKALKVGRKAIFIRVELTLEKKLIFTADLNEDKALGCYYMLTAFCEVSNNFAILMPWLCQNY